ncbi:MAG: type II toxin-antitoxin system HigB family toxin [Planctomycetes bacterium]|nr:type II toxin-antitoxin system HigB family toxin [Planctomycetota bacterium]
MLVVGRPDKTLKKHANARKPYEAWEQVASAADWRSLADIRQSRADVDRVGKCYVFDIGGNNFRLITKITFAAGSKAGIVLVRQLLTHDDYDRTGWKTEC